jgi:release factor glutamine methyltransferase
LLEALELSALHTEDLEHKFLTGVPFAYLTHYSEFYFKKFYVDERVLIPRNETELLVDLIHQEPQKFSNICDVGTGSGVILLSLIASGKAQKGLGIDISPKALEVAQINTKKLNLEDRVTLKLGDRLSGIIDSFDLIVSNPPYIKESSHRSLVHHQVDRFEPHQALFLKDEEYKEWFEIFFIQIKSSLLAGGLFWMEGHELELEDQARHLETLGFKNVQVLKDYAGLNRFIKATRG